MKRYKKCTFEEEHYMGFWVIIFDGTLQNGYVERVNIEFEVKVVKWRYKVIRALHFQCCILIRRA